MFGFYGMNYGSEMILVLAAIALSMFAQSRVKSTFKKYSKVISTSGYRGFEVARKILDRNQLYNIPIEMTPGELSDHYDPTKKILRLSPEVYNGNSVASIGVAAHEVGHAIQDSKNYAPLTIRNKIAPAVAMSSKYLWGIIFLGVVIGATGFIKLGIAIYIGVVIFQLVTLPVELDASKRAIENLENGILSPAEISPARSVLNAAAFTYVAATLVSIAELFRLIGISNRRN